MNSVIVAGVLLIHFALIWYSIFFYKEHKYKRATKGLLFFITLAVMFDMSATICMMIGTESIYFTLHGSLGYLALFIMIIDTLLIWQHKIKNGSKKEFSSNLNRYSKFAYLLWITAFATGEYLAIINH
jgi:TRAP-type C4-dicarboxylate transport system permease large subunit